MLVGDQLATQTKPGSVVLVKAAGRLEQGVLHVTASEGFHELVGCALARVHGQDVRATLLGRQSARLTLPSIGDAPGDAPVL